MKTIALRLVLFGTLLALSRTVGQNLEPAPANAPAAKSINPALVEVPDAPGLPRVLLLGDSISMGYTLQVRELLKGIANVHRPLENCGDTARGLAQLTTWLGTGHWDVIHFNFGLHDLKYLNDQGIYVSPERGKQVAPPDLYRKRLRSLTLQLKATGAKLVFATTTPVPLGSLGRVAGDELIYNREAIQIMKDCGVSVNDLCGYVVEEQKALPKRTLSEKPEGKQKIDPRTGEIQLSFNVHFTKQGYEELAKLVAASIEKELPARH